MINSFYSSFLFSPYSHDSNKCILYNDGVAVFIPRKYLFINSKINLKKRNENLRQRYIHIVRSRSRSRSIHINITGCVYIIYIVYIIYKLYD